MKTNTCYFSRNNIYFIVLLSCMYISCSNKKAPDQSGNEKILTLEYAEYSGEIGKTFSLIISKDSLKLFTHQLEGTDSILKAKKIPSAEWKKILNSFSLQNFKNVKSGKSNAPVDGRDEIFTIQTQTSTYRLVNGSTDYFHYWRIHGLTKYVLDIKKNGNL